MFDWVIYRPPKYQIFHNDTKVEQMIVIVTYKSTKLVKPDFLCM